MIDIKYCPICKSKNIIIINKIEYFYPEKIEEYTRDKRLRILFEKIAKCDKGEMIEFEFWKCNECSFIYSNPRLTNEEVLIKYYWTTEDMGIKRPIIDEGRKTKKKIRLLWVSKIREERLMEHLGKYANSEAKTLLDYGGADGKMCINLRSKYDCEIIELTKYLLPEGVRYIGENFECCKDKKYDIILLTHVLEHTNKPLEFLLILKRYLKKEKGIIIVSVPLGYIDEWKKNPDPLMHCNYFNQGSLGKVLDIAGYEYLEMKEYPKVGFGEIYYIGKIGEANE